MGNLYLLFLLLGSLGLLGSLIFGEFHHDFDFHHEIDLGHGDAGHADSPKIFSLRVIFAFMLAFGIGGGILYLNHSPLHLQVITGILSGVVTGLGVWYLMKFVYGFQGNSNVDSDSFIGKIAMVTIETTNSGLAQIKIDSTGGDQLFMAQEMNSKKLERHDKVKITGRVGNTIIVSKEN
ncbi:MAG: hypothetical protein PHF86_00300 [Candidatus Nanoarchaeia archaeon]|nr:hypothetical protein [Candidatus Nanoarchaeia archaeon]